MPNDDFGQWLNPHVVVCPVCATSLFQVDRSPFFDSWRVYCDQCPMSVEVSYYDDVVGDIRSILPLETDWDALFEGIERRLKACECGGAFRFDAARRCYSCRAVVTRDAGVDLFIYVGQPVGEYRDPTDAEEAAFSDWWGRFVIESEIWREPFSGL